MDIDREQISYIIGQRIYTFRTQKKLSQEALAFESEIHPAYLGRVERGEKCPTIETLYKISKGLKIPLHELLDVSIEVKPTNIEAFHRIQTAMQCLSEEESVEIAEIVEKMIAFKYHQSKKIRYAHKGHTVFSCSHSHLYILFHRLNRHLIPIALFETF